MHEFEIGNVPVGQGKLFLIAGPCVIESEAHALKMAEAIAKVTQQLKLPGIEGGKLQEDALLLTFRECRFQSCQGFLDGGRAMWWHGKGYGHDTTPFEKQLAVMDTAETESARSLSD